MARLIDSPLGAISGKAGSLVLKKSKYGNYISSLPSPSTKKSTKPQLLQQSKMKAVMHFLQPLQLILKETYFPLQQKTPVFNSIKSYYLRHAVSAKEEGYGIAYSKCLMSYGDIRIPEKIQLQQNESSEVSVSWEPNTDQALANTDDQLFGVVYHPPTHQFYFAADIGCREEGNGSFLLPQVWNSFTDFHLWLGYVRPTAHNASISVYVGQL